MKIISKVIPSLLLFLLLISCNNSVSPEMQNRFAIYLLKNDILTTKDVEGLELQALDLEYKPVILYEDIVEYNFENHKVFLKEKLSNYFGSDSLKIFSKLFGKPFVLIANGTRIYLGSFVTGISSWLPNTPKIVDIAVRNSEKSFLISPAPYYDISSFIDVRNDERIFQALRDKMTK